MFNVDTILNICNGKLIYGCKDITCDTFSNDTRTINKNDTYIAIKGKKYDGNLFYKEALERGASACILSSDNIDIKYLKRFDNIAIILVSDTLKALYKLASYKRLQYDIPVIAVTGSCGKTSTKDMIAHVLSKKYNVLKNEGNLNNNIGLSLTILKLKDHDILVLEMGMNHLGEISLLSNIARPNIAVITNIGTAHIGILGSKENILKAKLEILEGLSKDGVLLINGDDEMLSSWNSKKTTNKYNVLTYGLSKNCCYYATDIKLEENKSTYLINDDVLSTTSVGGINYVLNSLCSYAIGELCNVENNKILEAIKEFKSGTSRMNLIIKNNITVIDDSYNANYEAMKSSLEYLKLTNGKRKIAVLGDMLEFGDFSTYYHEKLGEFVKDINIDILIVVGNYSKLIAKSAINSGMDKSNVYIMKDNDTAIKLINSIKKDKDVILVKASNGMNFKEIVESITGEEE